MTKLVIITHKAKKASDKITVACNYCVVDTEIDIYQRMFYFNLLIGINK